LLSPDNPQFEAQPITVEPLVSVPSATDPSPVENPVWSGWDVLLIALLTFVAMVVLQLGLPVVAMRLLYRHETWLPPGELARDAPRDVRD
jgi:hypothetical protein